jgi:hypothetical protein
MEVRNQLYTLPNLLARTPPTRKAPPIPSGWVVPRASLDTFREEKNLFPLSQIEKEFPSEPACGVVTVLITLSKLLAHMSDLYIMATLYVSLTMQTE